jgi:hypothetical protein
MPQRHRQKYVSSFRLVLLYSAYHCFCSKAVDGFRITPQRNQRHIHGIHFHTTDITFSRNPTTSNLPTRTRLYNINNDDSTNINSNSNDTQQQQQQQPKEKNILDLVFNPYQSNIPKEIEKDIFIAEGNTQAAKDRTQRITVYATIAFIGVLCAFFNGFITELRNHPTLPDGSVILPSSSTDIDLLESIGFGWVYSNFIVQFLFTNKLGGLLCLLLGGGAGLLAEAEYDTRRINAEKIYTEIIRRRTAKQEGGPIRGKKSSSTKSSSGNSNSNNKRRSNSKEAKRLNALSEVAFDVLSSSKKPKITSDAIVDTPTNSASRNDDGVDVQAQPTNPGATNDAETFANVDISNAGNNILDKIKDFYNQADTMAATQALLLNKKLEEEGLLTKITDETGLKVIGKEAAAAATTTKGSNSTTKNEPENQTVPERTKN